MRSASLARFLPDVDSESPPKFRRLQYSLVEGFVAMWVIFFSMLFLRAFYRIFVHNDISGRVASICPFLAEKIEDPCLSAWHPSQAGAKKRLLLR